MTVTRTAVFEGRIKPGHEEAFFMQVKTKLAPLWRKFPGALDVRLLEITQRDEDAAPIVMIQQIDYVDLAAIETALQSPERTAARAATMEVMALFEGRFYHLISEGNAIGA
jgi:antibiotic biosynthesis monooxygenase (ABM) superfamily enzyme